MARYFKVIEIERHEFINAIGEDLDCAQMVAPTEYGVFAAIDEDTEDELSIPLDMFDY